MTNTPYKGIIYCRVSSHDQTKGTSLDNQQKACLDYAGNKGIEILKIFVEKGESATAANRTEFMKALEFCRENKNKINAFVVWKIDRFARNTTDHFAVRAKLIQYDTTLHSVTEPISQDPQGKLMETLLAGFAEFENEVRKQRCTAGMQGRLKQGIWCWSPPIGYINTKKITDRRKLNPDEPDPERFYLIQKGFKMYSTGNYTITELANLTAKGGLKTRTGLPIRKQLWEKMLRNKFYCGILVDPWSGEEHIGLHTAMISPEEFQQIQLIKRGLSNNAVEPRQQVHPDFPLRRFVFCTCSKKLTASWRIGRNKRYPYYHCNNKDCHHYTHAISKKGLEDKFVELLMRITPQEKFLRVFERAITDTWKNQHMAIKQEQQHYEQVLKSIESKRERLTQMRVNGEISNEEYIKYKDNIDNQMTTFQISRNEARTDEFDLEAAISYVIKFIGSPARQWQDMRDVKQKLRLQKLVLPEGITYNKTNGTFGTAVLSPIFKLNEEFDGNSSDLVAMVVRDWHQIIFDMQEICMFKEEVLPG